MGADGRIHIWDAKKVAEAWPSYKVLLDELRANSSKTNCGYIAIRPYWHTLAGVEYLVLYSSTSASSWWEFAHSDLDDRNPVTDAAYERFAKAKAFVHWLSCKENMAAFWEVWT